MRAEPDSADGRGWPRRLAGALAGVFPVLLLLLATFYFGGKIGFWSDDYWHNLRDPVTGALPPLNWDGLTVNRGFFIRPLFYVVVPAVTTLAWEAQWPAHLLQAAVHGVVVVLLWRLLMGVGVPRAAAGAASLLFMVYPAHFEAVLWVSAIPTAMAAALMLAMMLMAAGMARGEGVYSWRRGWWVAAVMPVLAFVLCCLNEQPAMGVFALPLVYFAARGERRGWRVELLRAFVPAVLAGCAVLVYTWLLVSDPSKPTGARGSVSQFVSLADLPARSAYFFDVLWRRLVLRNFWRGALGLGWAELRSLVGLVWIAGVVLTGAVWGWRWAVCERSWRPARPSRSRGPWHIVLAGVLVFATGWLPILALAVYDPDSRTRYWPMIGAAMALGVLFSGLGRVGVRWRVLRAGVAVVLLSALVFGAVCFVGVQSAFRARWRLDHEQGRQLVEQVPRPEALTFFVPLDVRSTGIRTGAPVFDTHFRSAWEFPWVTPGFIQGVYGRGDVRAGFYRGWTPRYPVAGADERGLIYADWLGPRFEQTGEDRWLVPWERAVPFVIDERARVRVVTHVVVDGKEFAVPQARGLQRFAFEMADRK